MMNRRDTEASLQMNESERKLATKWSVPVLKHLSDLKRDHETELKSITGLSGQEFQDLCA